MNTITLSNAAYNNAKHYADTQNLSVDEFVVMLIDKFVNTKGKKKVFKMLPMEKLEPEIQDILNMPRIGKLDADDVNGEEARMEYYKEKYML
jgi:hypothetical protein